MSPFKPSGLDHWTVLAAVSLAVRGRVQLTSRSVWRVWGLTNGDLVLAGIFNWTFGANFGYLASKPDHPSLLDYLGPWPYYLVALEVIALGPFFLSWGSRQAIERWAGSMKPVAASSRSTW